MGGLRWQLVLCFLTSWLIAYLCLFRGIKSSGKVVYVTALIPYVFLAVILIRGATLPGSAKGIKFYLSPDWASLLSWEIWSTAAIQIFYSLGPAWGGIITMASYNKFDHKVMRDGVLIPIICCLSSFYGGFAIFSVIGHMAHVSNTSDIKEVIQSGPGLAFVAYPEALAQLPAGCIFSVIFFLMLFALGLDSLFSTFESAISGLADEFPKFFGGPRKQLFTVVFVIMEALIGLIFCTRAGIYYFQIMDWYSTAISVVWIGFFEILVFAFVFDIRNILKIMDKMVTGITQPTKMFWAFCWCGLTPLCLMVVVISVIVGFAEPVFQQVYRYPSWAIIMGWCVAASTILPIPCYAVYVMLSIGFSTPSKWIKPNHIFLAMEKKFKTSFTDDKTKDPALIHNMDPSIENFLL